MLAVAASATPISIAMEFRTGCLLVTRKIAVRICGPITMIRPSGRMWSCVLVELKSRSAAHARERLAVGGGELLAGGVDLGDRALHGRALTESADHALELGVERVSC